MFFYFHRSIIVYGCFAAGLASLIIFAGISWFSGKADSENSEETTNQIALTRGIRITVYLITALLAVASSVISLIEVDGIAGYNLVPVRMLQNYFIDYFTSHFIKTDIEQYSANVSLCLNKLLLYLKINLYSHYVRS